MVLLMCSIGQGCWALIIHINVHQHLNNHSGCTQGTHRRYWQLRALGTSRVALLLSCMAATAHCCRQVAVSNMVDV
jgi:hypothetical protein